MNLNAERMAMQAGALVAVGYVWKPVGRLNLKNSENIHTQIVNAAFVSRNPLGVSILNH